MYLILSALLKKHLYFFLINFLVFFLYSLCIFNFFNVKNPTIQMKDCWKSNGLQALQLCCHAGGPGWAITWVGPSLTPCWLKSAQARVMVARAQALAPFASPIFRSVEVVFLGWRQFNPIARAIKTLMEMLLYSHI